MKRILLLLAGAFIAVGCSKTVQGVKQDTRTNISNVANAAERGTRNVADSIERTERRIAND